MSAIITIARTELGRVVRDRRTLFFILVMPIVISIIIGSTFFSQDNLPVGVVREGQGPLAVELARRLDRSTAVDVRRYESKSDLRADIRRNRVTAGVVIPDDYDRALDRGTDVRVTILSDPAAGDAAAVRSLVAAVVDDQGGRVAAARFAAGRSGLEHEEAYRLAGRVDRGLRPVAVRSSAVEGGVSTAGQGGFSYTVPANLVLFVFTGSLVVGSALVQSRQQGVAARLVAAPTTPWMVVLGFGASRLVFAVLQGALMVGVGALLFGIGWGDPLGVAALLVLFAAVSTAVGLLVGAMAANMEQAQAVGVPVSIGMAMLGGCMWPLWIVPDLMQQVGHMTPHAWAMDAWIELVLGQAGLSGIGGELFVLAAIAAVLTPLAATQLRRHLLN